ncbi:MAG: transporter [Chitinophagaceae bacterium]|nr:transporter [Chitinophagaceae bacterium]
MKHQWKPLLLVSYVFLFTGSIICMNDVLLPSLRDFFKLSYVQASFIQQSFYLVYLIFPIPIAYYISRYGYKTGLVTALAVCSMGSLFFIPAFYFQSYALALIALFVISIGVTLVNVAANPLAALLGDPSGSHIRVNFVQLFSRIGYSVTPLVATRLIYGSSGSVRFHIPYMILGAGTLIFALFILFSAIPALKPEILKGFSFFSILKESRRYPQLFWGAIAMFFYVGAEACTAGFFISYLRDVAGFDADRSATFLTYYYIASSVVCVIGIYLLRFFSPGKLVAVFGLGMIAMYLLAVSTTTSWNQWYLIGMGAFISIVYPSVFSMSIEGAGSFTEKGSALVNTAVVGGAVFPPLQGWLADSLGVQISYIVPCACFVVIVAYGIFCNRQAVKSKKRTQGI